MSTESKDLTYFMYQEVTGDASRVVNGSTLTLTLRGNCQSATNCTYCADLAATTAFTCNWCPELQRCSDGFESRYEDWQESCDTASTECEEDESANTTLQTLNDNVWQDHLAELME